MDPRQPRPRAARPRRPAVALRRPARRRAAPHLGEDAISAGLASDREAEFLDVTLPHAVLRTRRITFSGDTPVMFGQNCTRGDRHTLVVPLREPQPTIVPRTRRSDSAPDERG
ncbi:UTRA domain-containing protein [Xylanimonas allomyrinae]|uniref:UTRA domain-containing protein n=1 Tax=Xylanimonas allomyrinae TaxID=2509459 RepID=UPI003CCC5274